MERHRQSVRRWLTLVVLALAALVPLSLAAAQETMPVEYGAAIIGNVPADGTQVAFSFNGNVNELVTIRATGISPGMDPNLTLIGPAQEIVASNDNRLANAADTSAEVIVRLLSTGSYTVLVGGTPGDFLLTVLVRPPVTVTVLQLDTPAQLSLPVAEAQVFNFNTDPFGATSVLIDADPIDVNATIDVRDATGAQVATLHNNLDNACLSIGPGDSLVEITVIGAPEAAGAISITLGRGPCELGPAPEPQAVQVPVLQFQPVPIEGVCAASTIYNLNVRSGPGLQFPVLFVNFARLPLQVIGTSADNQWYAIQTTTGITGWIAAPIVVITGPCDALTVVEAQEPPPASPTPGVPLATPTVEATATLDPAQPTATLDPAQPTATLDPAQPTATDDPAQPTATSEPVEPTATDDPAQPTTEPPEPTTPPEETEAAAG